MQATDTPIAVDGRAAEPSATTKAATSGPNEPPAAAPNRASWTPVVVASSVGALLLGAAALEYALNGGDLQQWDWLLLSGLATFSVGVLLAQTVPDRLERMLGRLAAREALPLSPAEILVLRSRLDRRARVWGLVSGVGASVALLLAFVVAGGHPELAVAEALLAFPAGVYLGRMAAYGTLGTLLERQGTPPRAQPGHLDRAAGLKPVGDFYAYQAAVTALPALFLAIWWFLIPAWPYADYGHWRGSYLLLLPVAIAFEVLAFLAPMWSVHRQMVAQKAEHLRRADALSHELAEFQSQLGACEDDAKRRGLQDRMAAMTQEYWDVEQMPTWPVDLGKWRQFAASNLALASPLITEVFGLQGAWARLLKLLEGLLSGTPG